MYQFTISINNNSKLCLVLAPCLSKALDNIVALCKYDNWSLLSQRQVKLHNEGDRLIVEYI